VLSSYLESCHRILANQRNARPSIEQHEPLAESANKKLGNLAFLEFEYTEGYRNGSYQAHSVRKFLNCTRFFRQKVVQPLEHLFPSLHRFLTAENYVKVSSSTGLILTPGESLYRFEDFLL